MVQVSVPQRICFGITLLLLKRGTITGLSSMSEVGYWVEVVPSVSTKSSFYVICNLKSPLDGMYYTRGASDDYDGYAKLTGDPGWSWDNLITYIPRVRSRLHSPLFGCLSSSTSITYSTRSSFPLLMDTTQLGNMSLVSMEQMAWYKLVCQGLAFLRTVTLLPLRKNFLMNSPITRIIMTVCFVE